MSTMDNTNFDGDDVNSDIDIDSDVDSDGDGDNIIVESNENGGVHDDGDDDDGDRDGDGDGGGDGDDGDSDDEDEDEDEKNGGDDGNSDEDDGDGDEKNGGMLMDYIGGAQEMEGVVELEEDVLGESNKKIVHHNEVLFLHPESHSHNYDEIMKAAIVTRNEDNIIVDKLHTTTPILTKYERPRILGQRTKQLDKGEKPFVTMTKPIMDNSIIAEEELYQKKLPFIIQRGLPGGGFEYWHVRDLEVLRD